MSDRPCDLCDVVDELPRHIVSAPVNHIRHLHCCAADGCPVCAEKES